MSYHFPNGFISNRDCSTKFEPAILLLSEQICLGLARIPPLPFLLKERRYDMTPGEEFRARDGGMEESHDPFAKMFLPGSGTAGGNSFCP